MQPEAEVEMVLDSDSDDGIFLPRRIDIMDDSDWDDVDEEVSYTEYVYNPSKLPFFLFQLM